MDFPDSDDAVDQPDAHGPAGSRPGARGTLLDALAEMLGDDRLAWQSQANCQGLDPDLFFPERGASTREAKTVCGDCAVKGDCLEWALAAGEKFGIWGGTSERERRRLRKARRSAAAEDSSAAA